MLNWTNRWPYFRHARDHSLVKTCGPIREGVKLYLLSTIWKMWKKYQRKRPDGWAHEYSKNLPYILLFRNFRPIDESSTPLCPLLAGMLPPVACRPREPRYNWRNKGSSYRRNQLRGNTLQERVIYTALHLACIFSFFWEVSCPSYEMFLACLLCSQTNYKGAPR